MNEPQKHAEWKKPDRKDHNFMIPLIWNIQNRISIEIENVSVVRSWVDWGMGSNFLKALFWGDENVSELDRGGDCTTL